MTEESWYSDLEALQTEINTQNLFQMCENGCFFEYKILLKTFTALLRAQKYSKNEILRNFEKFSILAHGSTRSILFVLEK